MNFSRPNPEKGPRLMKEGDVVILYERHDSLDHVRLKRGEKLHNRFGCFFHNDIIGKPFGSKVKSYDVDCWLYVMEPTPELWSSAFKTRTQIVNEMDQSLVTFMLNVKPGDIVVESGTGSACMTLSLARAVSHPTKPGHVYTFEFNKVRAEEAAKDMKVMGVDHLVTVRCHDVCAKYDVDGGGGFPGVAPGTADALFLDVPEPASAIGYALTTLKPYANICCYSPCISQVIDTCAKLRELKFTNIRMIEFRQRPYDGREFDLENIDLGEEAVAVSAAIAQSEAQNEENTGKEEEEQEEGGQVVEGSPTKKRKSEVLPSAPRSRQAPQVTAPPLAPTTWRFARALPSMKGHTAFLTFAKSPLPDFDINTEKQIREQRRLAGKAIGDDKRGAAIPQGLY